MSDASDPLVFAAVTDIAGLLRGKAFPAGDWDKRVARGVGWTPTNVQINCFDVIAESPFGALGDLLMLPDPETRIRLPAVDGRPALDFALADIVDLDGAPWAFCTRGIVRRALDAVREAAGLDLVAAFEHEFQLTDVEPRSGDGYGFRGFRDAQDWAEALLAAMRVARIGPDTFMKEYGPAQYEVTCRPAEGLAAADTAAILRMLTAEVAGRFGHMASFAPILDPDGVGNGVHIHVSLRDGSGEPATCDMDAPYGLSEPGRHFIGGVLAHLDQIIAILAPSDVSYLRLTPHRWSAAFNNLGFRDREASVRICPVTGRDPASIERQFNFELRACDAAASPHLALAALAFAGAEGLRRKIEPPAVTEADLSEWSSERLAEHGLQRLPQSLPEALDRLDGSQAARAWFGDVFVDAYLAHKRSEIACLEGLDDAAKCARYGKVY